MSVEPSLAPELSTVLLVALRWWALLSVQVLWRSAVGRTWPLQAAGLAVVLALGGAGGVAMPGPVSVPGAVAVVDPWLAAGAELGLGAVVGLVVALPGYALRGAAQASAQGLSTAVGPWRSLTMCLVAATALSLGLHRPLLLGADALAQACPVGDPLSWASLSSTVQPAQLAHATALLALSLATPVLLAGAVAELLVRAVGLGAAPMGSIADAVAPCLRVAAALVATGASWAAYDAIWAQRALATLG